MYSNRRRLAKVKAPDVSSIPIGVIIMWLSESIPADWAICDGSPLLVSDYSKLYSVIGNQFGGDSTTFNIPNFSGRSVVGKNISDSDFNHVGQSGGELSTSLSTSKIPSHTHTQSSCSSAGAHTHPCVGGSGSSGGSTQYGNSYATVKNYRTFGRTTSAGAHTHTLTLGSQGSGTEPTHNNTPPYVVGYYIIKVR